MFTFFVAGKAIDKGMFRFVHTPIAKKKLQKTQRWEVRSDIIERIRVDFLNCVQMPVLESQLDSFAVETQPDLPRVIIKG